jgi:MepB protein
MWFLLSSDSGCAPPRPAGRPGAGLCALLLNGLRVQYRVAKITPTKVGQFVTLWKRVGRGPIQPFDLSDPVVDLERVKALLALQG